MADHRFSDRRSPPSYRAIAERRDVRHFRPTRSTRPCCSACCGPPTTPQRRLHAAVALHPRHRAGRCASSARPGRNRTPATARALGERQDDFMRLKVEGLLDAGEGGRGGAGRRPRSTSSAAARCPRWTSPRWPARSRTCGWRPAPSRAGLGVDLRPVELARLLGMPAGARQWRSCASATWKPFCPRPMLEMEQWAERMPIDSVMAENSLADGRPKTAAFSGLAARPRNRRLFSLSTKASSHVVQNLQIYRLPVNRASPPTPCRKSSPPPFQPCGSQDASEPRLDLAPGRPLRAGGGRPLPGGAGRRAEAAALVGGQPGRRRQGRRPSRPNRASSPAASR